MYILKRVWFIVMFCIASNTYAQSWNWARAVLSTGSEAAQAVAVVPTNGNVLSCGYFNQTISNLPGNPSPSVTGVTNGLVLAQDSGGNYLAHTVIRCNNPLSLEGIATDDFGNIYLTGSFSGTADFRGNSATPLTTTTTRNRSLFVAKLDASLRGVWAKADTNAIVSEGNGIDVYYDQVFVCGNYLGDFSIDSLQLPTTNDTDALALRIDALTAGISWGKEINGPGIEIGTSIAADHGQVFIGGYFTSDTLRLGGGIAPLLNSNSGTSDVFVASLRGDSGMVIWAKGAGGFAEDVCHGLSVDFQSVYATGNFTSTSNFGTVALTSRGNSDAYLWAMDRNNGSTSWATQEGDVGMDSGSDIDIDEIGNIVWLGEFAGTVQFAGTVPLTATGTNGTFCTSYQTNGTPTNWAISAGNTDYSYGNALVAGRYGIFVAGSYNDAQLDFQGAPALTLAPDNFSNYYVAALNCGTLYGLVPSLMTSNDSLCVGASFDVQLFNALAGLNYGLFDATADTLVGSLQPGNGGLLNFSSGPLPFSMDFNLVVLDASGRCQQNLGYYFVQVSPLPQFSLGADTTFCTGDSVLLTPTGGPYMAYSWNNGSMVDSIYASAPGTYWLDVKNNFSCTGTDTIVLQQVSVPNAGIQDGSTCVGTSATFTNPFPAFSCLWSDNSTGDTATFATGGAHWIELSQGTCVVRDSFLLNLLAPPYVNLGPDTTICNGQSLLLDPTDDPSISYTWSNSTTDTTLAVSTAGSYAVSVTGPNGCIGVDQINVTIDAPVNLFAGTSQTVFCEFAAPVTLLPTPPGGMLSGDIGPGNTIDPALLGPGNYLLNYIYTTPGGCRDSVGHAFLIAPAPSPANAGPDQVLSNSNQAQLAGNTPAVGTGTWTSAASVSFSNANLANAIVSGLPVGTSALVWTINTPACGSSSDTVLVTAPVIVALSIPTGFSPNGDGFNDTWEVAGLEMYAQRELKIFNRWGAAVYENGSWANNWDASNNGGAALPDDTYYYVLDLGGDQQFAGYLVIKR